MKSTEVQVSVLLERLQENRDAHDVEYRNARRIWLKKAIKELRKVADRAEKTKTLNGQSFDPLRKLPKPISYLHSYDTMIARLEVEVKETVELDEREFQAYWLDNWDWKSAFVGTTSLYNAQGV